MSDKSFDDGNGDNDAASGIAENQHLLSTYFVAEAWLGGLYIRII